MMQTPMRSLLQVAMLLAGLTIASCTVSTDPTKPSSDFTSSSSGSSSSPPKAKNEEKIRDFTTVNFERLKEDMASGHGEHLTSLATLLGVPQESQGQFCMFTQEKFADVVRSEQVTPEEMLAALRHELSVHPVFHTLIAQN
ncbi:MAG: DUF3015 family protein [Deltaproteobacteria bacterium]|nr:DUF3015 family protein [Deltaproteobacteria bacterium]